MDEKYKENYENLANAIIVKACKDYKVGSERQRKLIEHFFKSEMFLIITDLCPETLIRKLREEVHNGH